MDQDEIQFIYFWIREHERQQLQQLGRLLGVSFEAHEVRGWAKQGGAATRYKDHDAVLMPLTLALRPELREALIKMVGLNGMSAPEGYQKRDGEFMVNLGDIPIEEFKNFLQYGVEPPSAKRMAEEQRRESERS